MAGLCVVGLTVEVFIVAQCLDEIERVLIEVLFQEGFGDGEICLRLGRSRATVWGEK